MKPHPDEVDDVKWVTPEEMDAMMDDKGKCPGSKSFTPLLGLPPPKLIYLWYWHHSGRFPRVCDTDASRTCSTKPMDAAPLAFPFRRQPLVAVVPYHNGAFCARVVAQLE